MLMLLLGSSLPPTFPPLPPLPFFPSPFPPPQQHNTVLLCNTQSNITDFTDDDSSPLAGGFLTGTFSLGHPLANTRFAPDNPMGAHYKPMYDKPAMHAAVRELHAFLQPRGLGIAEAALRWLVHHSQLGEGDALVLGATGKEQVERNVGWIARGELEGDVVGMFERVWEGVGGCAP